MLVIDLVELIAFDRLEKMWKLYSADSAHLENNGDPFDERVEVWNLGQDIVADNEVCLSPGFGQRICRLNTEKFHQSRHSAFLCGASDISGRVDTKNRNALLDKEL